MQWHRKDNQEMKTSPKTKPSQDWIHSAVKLKWRASCILTVLTLPQVGQTAVSLWKQLLEKGPQGAVLPSTSSTHSSTKSQAEETEEPSCSSPQKESNASCKLFSSCKNPDGLASHTFLKCLQLIAAWLCEVVVLSLGHTPQLLGGQEGFHLKSDLHEIIT